MTKQIMVFPVLLLSLLCSYVHAADSPDGTLTDILKPWTELMECSTGTPEIQRLCQVVAGYTDNLLHNAGFSITKDAILYNYDDGTDIKLDTGHECSVTAKIHRRRASVRLDGTASIHLSGNPISGAGLVAVALPVSMDAKIDVTEKTGVKLLGCTNLGSCSFDVIGSVSTVARLLVFFALAPQLRKDKEGNFVVTIKPIVDVIGKLDNTQIDAHVHNNCELNAALGLFLALPSTSTQFLTDWVTQDFQGALDTIKNQFPMDLAMGIGLSLPDPVLNEIVPIIAREVVKKKLKGADTRYSQELKTSLEGAIARALGLDSNGERSIVIRKDFITLLDQFGIGADVFLPDKAKNFCVSDAECDDGTWCNGAERCIGEKCQFGTYRCSTEFDDECWMTRCNERKKECQTVARPGGTCV
jgi:hypothetical protein